VAIELLVLNAEHGSCRVSIAAAHSLVETEIINLKLKLKLFK
jgi:hypothetical protein